MAAVEARIEDAGHAFIPDGPEFVAQVHERGLRARFDADGAHIGTGDDTLGVRFAGIGRDAAGETLAASPELGACQDGMTDPTGGCIRRLEYVGAGVTGWWAAKDTGFEQGWTVESPPAGTGPLAFDVGIDGATVTVDGNRAWLHGDEGGLLTVDGLEAWDADGKALAVRMVSAPQGLRVLVDDRDARYPVEVDPFYSTANWTVDGVAGNNPIGNAVSGAGDVNGDGYADVLVGANAVGTAYLYEGSASGISSTASATLTGGMGFGAALAPAGDVNRDGYADVIIGEPGSSRNTGKAYIFLGSASGLSTSATTTFTGAGTGYYFGESVAGAGDVNGDGYDDVVVGAYGNNASYVFLGAAAGPAASASTTLTASAEFGWSVAGAGDVNGDGFDDVIVGAPTSTSNAGRAYVYEGSASGLSTSSSITLTGAASSNYFGYAVAGAGDVDGDGFGEVIVGAYGYSSSTGRAYVYEGSAAGTTSAGVTTLTGDSSSDEFGWSVAAAGDVNHDGYADVVVGEPKYSGGVGRSYVFTGSLAGLNTAAWSYDAGDSTRAVRFGYSVAGVGDTNGDGYDDIISGSDEFYEDVGGGAYLSLGGAGALTPSTGIVGMFDDELGSAVAAAGDVNHDGYGDVVIGAPGNGKAYVYQGSAAGLPATASAALTGPGASSLFGGGVAGVGDVNGDGYDDVVIGARDASTVYVFQGSASGTVTTASATLAGSGALGSIVAGAGDVNGDGYDDLLITSSGSIYIYSGSSSGPASRPTTTIALSVSAAASAGDVNGDGYDDIIVGDYYYSSRTGEAWVYLGAASGLTTSPATTLYGYNISDVFGYAVAGVGDVNGDGYGDVAIGADGYNGEVGRVYIYDGSPTGLTAVTGVITGTAADSRMGYGIEPAGDVDHDGYDDVLVLAYQSGTTWEVLIFPGSASGVSGVALETVPTASTTLAVAGDVNGDGLADLIIGDPTADSNVGTAYLLEGYADADGDGYGAADDCDDHDPAVAGPYTGYADADGDGYGNAADTTEMCGFTPGYVNDGTDCDDGDAAVHPGATEICDASDTDEDCNGLADDADPGVTGFNTTYVDRDGDGYGDPAAPLAACDPSPGSVAEGTDCDDGDAAISPSATELCDVANVDEDCNGVSDDADTSASGKTAVYRDADGDGYGGAATMFCDPPGSGYVATSTDCDDTNGLVHPGATEICDALDTDEDCNGVADDADSAATGKSTFYVDADGDGYGAGATALFCDPAVGYAFSSTDCNDASAAVHPGATEVCDVADVDEDCDGLADDAAPSASGKSAWYTDTDGDGYGGGAGVLFCDMPVGYFASSTDCNDGDSAVHPGANEVCDAADTDEDCDGLADDADGSVSGTSRFYADGDGDGFGGVTTADRCDVGPGYAETPTDCDDGDSAAHPGATELTGDEKDEDCDGGEICYVDGDADGFRGSATTPSADDDCSDAGESPASAAGDCDDADPTVNGGSPEVPGDGVDEDCDGQELCYLDADADGYAPDATHTVASGTLDCSGEGLADDAAPTGDCDDASALYHPGADEADCTDPNDYNCDGSTGYTDADADGFAACAECDDGRSDVNPSAAEVCDGVDNDCDGTVDQGAVGAQTWYADGDGDGYANPSVFVVQCTAPEGYIAATADDCDDTDPTAHPGAADTPDDGVDQDCDGADATAGGDTAEDTGGSKPAGGTCGCATASTDSNVAVVGILAALAMARRGRTRGSVRGTVHRT